MPVMAMMLKGAAAGGGGGLPKTLWYKSWTGLWQDTSGTTPATANGDPVRRWDDQSGNGNNATVGGVSQRPHLDTGTTLNGHQTILFAAVSSELLSIPNVLGGLTAGELFLSIKVQNDPPGSGGATGIYHFDGSGTANSTHYPWTDGHIYDKFGTTTRYDLGNPTPALTSWRIYNPHSGTNDWAAYLDNSLLFSSATNTVSFSTGPTIGVSSGSLTVYLDGWLSELIFYPSVLSSSDRTTTYNYMSTGTGSPA